MTDADIARWFRPALTPGQRADLYDLVARADAALRGLGLDYVLYGGALLGLCSSGELLPWDDDADLLVLSPVHPDELAARLAAALPGLSVHAQVPRLLKVSRPAPPGSPSPWSVPFVDVGFMYAWRGSWCHDSVWGGTDAFPAADVTPAARARLGAVEVSVPARPEAVCRRKYGADCLTSALPPAYDHLAERPTGHPRVRVPLGRIERVLRGGPAPDRPTEAAPAPTPAAEPARRGEESCVALVPSGRVVDRAFEEALAELKRRGHPVRRLRQEAAPPGFRDRMTADALAAGFAELLWLDPAITFAPDSVARLRALGAPVACGVYPASGWAGLACEFPPGTSLVRLGTGGGPAPVLSCGMGFALVRREVFDALARQAPPGQPPAFFAIAGTGGKPGGRAEEDVAFCRRARACGFEVVADTSIRLWRTGRARLGWEDAGGERERHDDFTLRVLAGQGQSAPPGAAPPPAQAAGAHPGPARSPLRGPAAPLPEGFPRVRLFVVTYPANAGSLAATLQSVRESDWGEEPVVITQPADWPRGRESGSRNYKRALEAAAEGGCDFALVLEDDVRVCRHLRHNLLSNPLVRRDQCDYLGLFVPDLLADPWERREPHLGYRLARPRYSGPNKLWERNRVWGAQGYLLSRRLVLAALERWDRLTQGQDTRVITVCSEFRLPLWYSEPCLVEHAPVESAFGTPEARAPDFDPDFRLELGPGFQPPEAVPGRLTIPEAKLLWETASGRDVLELGTAGGRSAASLGQSARAVVSVDLADQSEAAEWARRFGVSGRVEFRRGDAAEVCRELKGRCFDLVFIDTPHDAASAARDVASALPLLAPGGLLAFHDYPDPLWPDVRRAVDGHARRLGWRRVAQADFLGVFRT